MATLGWLAAACGEGAGRQPAPGAAADPAPPPPAAAAAQPQRVRIAVTPVAVTLRASDDVRTVHFQAAVENAPGAAVRWEVLEGPAAGTIDAGGVFTASAQPGVFHVVALTEADPAAQGQATVTWVEDRPLLDGGGLVLAAPRVLALWWGPPAAFGDAAAVVGSFFTALEGAPWLDTLGEYLRGERARVSFVGHVVDASAPPALEPAPAALALEICRMLDAAGQPPSADAFYAVYTATRPAGMAANGWHAYGVCHGVSIAFAYLPFDDPPRLAVDPCGAVSPGAAALVAVSSHELTETMTNPALTAWRDAGGGEVADRCAWRCRTLGGAPYLVNDLWSNAERACVAR